MQAISGRKILILQSYGGPFGVLCSPQRDGGNHCGLGKLVAKVGKASVGHLWVIADLQAHWAVNYE